MAKIKKVLLALLACLTTVTCFAGCSDEGGLGGQLGDLFGSDSKKEEVSKNETDEEEEEEEEEESSESEEEEEEIEPGVPVLKGDEVFIYDEDGERIEKDEEFVEIDGDTYYVVGNEIVEGMQVIDRSIYDFGDNGKMTIGSAFIDDVEFTYDENGRLIATDVFITINEDIYYMLENLTVNGMLVIGDYIYDFGNDGRMIRGENGDYEYDNDGRMIADEEFVEIDGDTYYLEENRTVKDSYKVVDDRIYRFGEDGKRLHNGEHDGHEFGEDGYMTSDFDRLNIDGDEWFVIEDNAYIGKEVEGYVYESDNDYDLANNEVLANVSASILLGGQEFTFTTDEYGRFYCESLPAMTITFHFMLDGYKVAEITINCREDGTIEIVMDRDVNNTLTGKIVLADADLNPSNNAPLVGATVSLVRASTDGFSNGYEATTVTDDYGYYTFTGMTAGVYDLVVEKEGYLTISQAVQVRYNETTVQNLQLEAIEITEGEEEVFGYAAGTIKDARTGATIGVGLTVYIREGINNFIGEVIATVTTDANGDYITPELPAGNYTAQVVDERAAEALPDQDEDYRYGSQTIALKVLAGQTIYGQDATISNNVGIVAGTGIRVVLTWGSTPSDLDSHLLFGSNHVYYSSKNIGNCSLDVDDTSAYGPETITIEEVQSYTYKYYVYNYSKSGTFYNANAVVKVYSGAQLLYTFNAPTGSGYYWHIFTLNGATGEFTIHNQTSSYAM